MPRDAHGCAFHPITSRPCLSLMGKRKIAKRVKYLISFVDSSRVSLPVEKATISLAHGNCEKQACWCHRSDQVFAPLIIATHLRALEATSSGMTSRSFRFGAKKPTLCFAAIQVEVRFLQSSRGGTLARFDDGRWLLIDAHHQPIHEIHTQTGY